MQAQVHMVRQQPMREAVDTFLAVMMAGMTRKAYGEDLTRFIAYLEEQGCHDITADKVEPSHIAGFRDEELRRVSASTLVRRMSALSSFFRWAIQEGLAFRNPVKGIRLPKSTNPLMEVLTVAEVLRLIQAPNCNTWIGTRDQAILSVGYYCGLRVSEIIGIKEADIVYDKKERCQKAYKEFLHVVGKGGKARDIPLNKEALKHIGNWLDLKWQKDGMSDYLFVTSTGGPISDDVVRYALVKYAKKAAIDKKVTPHSLRHAFASHLVSRKVDVATVQAYLGHSSLITTSKYLHLLDESFRTGVDQLPTSNARGKRVFAKK
jgi:integrase/recombinase XerC